MAQERVGCLWFLATRIRAFRRICMVNNWNFNRNLNSSISNKHLNNMTELYSVIYGDEWPLILANLKQETSFCALKNTLLSKTPSREMKISSARNEELTQSVNSQYISKKDALPENESLLYNLHDDKLDVLLKWKAESVASQNLVIYKRHNKKFQPPISLIDEIDKKLPYYLMDLASLVPIIALDIKPSDIVLDMCAAPGGKSLAILSMLSKDGQLIANEYSNSRRRRLYKVLREYVPQQASKNISVTNINGISFGITEPSTFDKVLLDAPCSSDRHLIQSGFKHSGWSIKRSRDYANLQKQLLISALSAVKIEGTVVYSTCTLSPYENDDVIEQGMKQALEKHNIRSTILDVSKNVNAFTNEEFHFNNATEHGVLIVPSEIHNWGPMYTCKIERKS